MRLFKNMNGKTARLMGETAEILVELCFQAHPELQPKWLKSVRRSSKEEDEKGIDIVVEVTEGEVVFQIKSGHRRANFFKKDHPNIPVIVINPEDSEDFVRRKFLSFLGDARKSLRAVNKQI